MFNPHYQLLREDSVLWISHNKGVSQLSIDIEGSEFELFSTHMIPFRVFGINPEIDPTAKSVIGDFVNKIDTSSKRVLIQGDFNLNTESLKSLMPDIFNDGLEEIIFGEPTTPKGRKYDRVLYKGFKLRTFKVVSDALTDHFPIFCEFEL